MSYPPGSSAMLAAISLTVYMCAMPGREQQSRRGELVAPGVAGVQHPVLLARGVGVVRADPQRGLDHLGTELDERAGGVADHLRAVERGGEGIRVVLDADDLVVGGLDARDLLDDGAHAIGVAARRPRTERPVRGGTRRSGGRCIR